VNAYVNFIIAALPANVDISFLRVVTGSAGSPVSVTAVGGITPAGASDELIFVSGSGGAVDITANPQIAAGTTPGQRLTLRAPDGANGVLLEDGDGLSMNGPADLGVDTTSISFEWDGSEWCCYARE
jgi:hypothetical protein